MIQPLDPTYVRRLLEVAFAEDLADGPDATSTATIPAGHRSRASLVSRAPGVVAGLAFAQAAFTGYAQARAVALVADGARVEPGTVVMTVEGPTRGILTAERTALNFLGRLSGIASLTAAWVDAIADTGAAIRDTRKTTPGLRLAEKFAVRCGGGVNHRLSLSDEALIKDNHIAATGSVTAAIEAVRRAYPGLRCEVECDTVDQVREAVAAGAEMILLDNMSLDDLRSSVSVVALAGKTTITEASGGLTLERARAVAETGVTYLSVGGLTHSATVLDIGLDFDAVLDPGSAADETPEG